MLEKKYGVPCMNGRHVQYLDREEMVKVFGEQIVSEIDASTRRYPVIAPLCMECDEDDEAERAELENAGAVLEMFYE